MPIYPFLHERRINLNKNKELLQNWIDHGYAVADAGDGEWGWTEMAKAAFYNEPLMKVLLSGILYSEPHWVAHAKKCEAIMNKYGFSIDGFVLEE